jgi:hypothetical protein
MQEIDHLIGLKSDTTTIHPLDIYVKSWAMADKKPQSTAKLIGVTAKVR